MDGMNQNNNPYGQQGGWQQNGGPYQAGGPYDHNPYRQNEGEGQPAPQPQNYGQQGYQAQSFQQQDYRQQSYQGYQQQGGFGMPPVQPYVPRGQGYGRKIAIGIVCGLAVLIAAGIGALAYYRSRPAYKIAAGFRNLALEAGDSRNPLTEKIGMDDIAAMMREEGSHVESTLDFTLHHFLPYLDETTFGVDTDFYKDMREKQMSAETSLSLMNYDFAHLNLYADEEVFCFSLPELFLENLYIENENVVSQYNQSILADGTPSDMEDFSIDLFAESGQASLWDAESWMAAREIQPDISACREAMTLEKVEKGVYRVTFPRKESDRLLKSILEHYGAMPEDDLEDLKSYRELVLSDVSFLLEIGKGNRIESIMLEEPVEMLDGAGRLDAELFFLGEERSIDKIQGKFTAYAGDDVDTPLAVVWQIQQTADDEIYRVDMDMKLDEDGETTNKIKVVLDCDAVKDTVSLDCSVKDEWSEMQLVLEGSIDDYVTGESVEFSLDRAAFNIGGEDFLKLTGDISIEPLQGTIEPSVRPEKAFFDLSWEEWYDIIAQIDDAYGSLLDSLW